ncbi:MAG: peptidoglycan DD-metalloendopeptidase family protein [Pseudomonadota bacterium]
MIGSGSRAHWPFRIVFFGLLGTFAGGFLIGAFSASGLNWPTLDPVRSDGPSLTDKLRDAPLRLAFAPEGIEIATTPNVTIETLEVDPGELHTTPLFSSVAYASTGSDVASPPFGTHTLEAFKAPTVEDVAATPLADNAEMTTYVVERGDTLVNILLRAGLEADHAHHALTALGDTYDPRTLQPGQEIEIATAASAEGDSIAELRQLVLDIDFENELQLTAAEDGYEVAKLAKILDRETRHVATKIDDSLYLAAARKNIPTETTFDLVKLFSWDLDFQRDIQAGHSFELIYEELLARDRRDSRGGPILYAKLQLGNRLLEAHRFERGDGMVGYYDPEGRSVRKEFMRTPIDGARLSSGFGRRKHPILGYTKMHKGVDFAASTGTPIFAAGDGTVEVAQRNGGYGNYIRIRHNGEYSTAYAHLSQYAKGIKAGKRVSQGQVIGYVGSTGRSTGPHLHYEVIQNGQQVNPMSMKSDVVEHLTGSDLVAFKAQLRNFSALKQRARQETILAQRADF